MPRIPRDRDNDYSEEAIRRRREFIEEQTDFRFEHLGSYSLDPSTLKGNVEHFTGIAQMPIGFAGPLLVNGEHAQGEFYVPMATTEGTLVASYNRGMSLTREAGGIMVTVVDDAMQRAPVFVFDNAREARAFGLWISENFSGIKAAAEATTSVGKLRDIEQYAASRMLYLRFNYTTGDAAGQNMAGKATLAACHWIIENFGRVEYYLSGNMDTDKKHSTLNSLHSRGKRVIAEVTIPDAILRDRMRVSAEQMFATRRVSQFGALMAGAVYNGVHPANGIAATFIATGQDEANVAESHAAFTYAEVTRTGDYYYSITLPSLIVATYGGGTGLATQRECLESLGCYGRGKAHKLAEIIGATVLCGELSLGAAVIAEEWVSSHETYGRNR
ncbi:MAG: hydroxymethylglutaryl-CoA reductase [Gammaproteobacteria bacterium]